MVYKIRKNFEKKLFKEVPLKVRGRARQIARQRSLPIEDALELAQKEYEKRKKMDLELEHRKEVCQKEKERQRKFPDKPRGKQYFGGVVQGGAPGLGRRS